MPGVGDHLLGGIEQVTQRIDGPECCILHLLCGVCRLIAHPVILEPQPTTLSGFAVGAVVSLIGLATARTETRGRDVVVVVEREVR